MSTERVLRDAGWWPGRQAKIDGWVAALESEGFRIHPAAQRFLTEFGGLTIHVDGPGVTRYKEPFSLYPTSCSGEEDRITDWGRELGKTFYPLGAFGQRSFFIVMDSDGEVFLMMDDVGALGPGDTALEKLISGIAADWLE